MEIFPLYFRCYLQETLQFREQECGLPTGREIYSEGNHGTGKDCQGTHRKSDLNSSRCSWQTYITIMWQFWCSAKSNLSDRQITDKNNNNNLMLFILFECKHFIMKKNCGKCGKEMTLQHECRNGKSWTTVRVTRVFHSWRVGEVLPRATVPYFPGRPVFWPHCPASRPRPSRDAKYPVFRPWTNCIEIVQQMYAGS